MSSKTPEQRADHIVQNQRYRSPEIGDGPLRGEIVHAIHTAIEEKEASDTATLLSTLETIDGLIGDAIDQKIRSGRLPPIGRLLSTIQDEAQAAITLAKTKSTDV